MPEDLNQQIVDEFRAASGAPGGRLGHLPLLLLTTTGARSGQPRTVPLTYVAYGDGYLVAAGAAGGNPAWLHNVRAERAVTVEVGTEKFDALAEVVPEAIARKFSIGSWTSSHRYCPIRRRPSGTSPWSS